MPQSTDFTDEAAIFVKGGDGGNGARSFRREKFVPFGGPDGGDGGRGGDVILRGSRAVTDLSELKHRRRFSAKRGGDGRGSKQHGARGSDLVVGVPLGTRVMRGGEVLTDITREEQRVEVARGGKGGLGNVHFATPIRRAPRFAQRGEPGAAHQLELELRTIGDVGLVGPPNVGKSSLLAAMTAAQPEVAEYPFTTLTPNLGVATIGETAFVLVDIPGLIEGAHEGAGLGHRFLRHVERAALIVHVVDASVEDGDKSYELVRREMAAFDCGLLEKPQLLALNKIDVEGARERARAWSMSWEEQGVSAYLVSALTGEGAEALAEAMAEGVAAVRRALPSEEAAPVRTYRAADEAAIGVAREGGGFRVSGRRVERLVAMADLETDDGLAYLQRQLDRLGVDKALREAGVREGDLVRIGPFELEWA